jgi:uncharacterized protein with HEPN domain
MQRDHLYAIDILRACETIAKYVASTDRETFLADDLLQGGVAFQFSIIGEAVRNLPDDLKQRYPHVAWVNARDLRNLIAHRYFTISWPIIWDTATISIPVLRSQIAAIIDAEFGDADTSSDTQ